MKKRSFSFLLFFLFPTLLSLPVISHAQSALDGFNPSVNNGIVRCLAVQADGKILIGGSFTSVGTVPVTRNRIARLNADGSLDTGFNPNANNDVDSIAVQTDGKILIGGFFTTIGGQGRNRIARLNSDGSLDPGFDPNANSSVFSIVVQPDAKILIGGNFTTVGTVPVTRNRIARLNPDGNLDTEFAPDADAMVRSIALQPDGKILLGGYFGTVGNQPRNRIARLNPNGSLDPGFNISANGGVLSIALQPDGKILIGGEFGTIGAVTRTRVARLHSDGGLDTGFDPDMDLSIDIVVFSVVLQVDGKILIGGYFNSIGGVTRNRIARLNRNGTLDLDFAPAANNGVQAIAIQADEKILIGGEFTNTALTTRNRIARIYPDGSLDRDFNPNANNWVHTIAVQPDGKTLIGGDFTTVTGQSRPHMTRVYPDGSLDPTFFPDPNDFVHTIAAQPDGKTLIAGRFTALGPVTENSPARLLNESGSLDSGFNRDVNPDNYIFSILLQPDNKILVGGAFSNICGQPRNRVARLNSDGTLDTTFVDPNVEGNTVYAIVLQPDGKILVGGQYTSVGGQPRNNIARLNADGTVDMTFNPHADYSVQSIALQPDGRILVGGNFITIDGQPRSKFARLNANGTLDTGFADPNANNDVRSIALQTDGKIIVGGIFTTIGGETRNRIARFHPNGTLDTAFNLSVVGTWGFRSIALQSDGKVLVGGDFTAVGGQTRNYIARLTNTSAALQELSISSNGGTLTWRRGQASPEVSRVTFEHSSDGLAWESLGNGTRISGGWQLAGFSLPRNQNHYVRARGHAASGNYNGSGSLFESVRMIYIKPIFGIADYNGDAATDVAAFHLASDQFFSDYSGNMGQYGWGGSDCYPLLWDYDGNGATNVSVYHIPSNQWFVRGVPGDNLGQLGWGADEAAPVPGDYDGDGWADEAFYHWPTNRWFIKWGDGSVDSYSFGWGGADCVPIAADYDGDGAVEMILYHIPSNQWFVYGFGELGQFGWNGEECIPVPGDWDGDGRTEIGIYHVPSNSWFWRDQDGTDHFLGQYGWGGMESFPIPGDYNGDGALERAFYRPAENRWFIEGRSEFVWGWGGQDFMPVTSQISVYNWYRFVLGRFQ
jgi:uncharacterized delta-60 repeat protein